MLSPALPSCRRPYAGTMGGLVVVVAAAAAAVLAWLRLAPWVVAWGAVSFWPRRILAVEAAGAVAVVAVDVVVAVVVDAVAVGVGPHVLVAPT